MRTLLVIVLLAISHNGWAASPLSYDSTSIDFGHVSMFGSKSATVRIFNTGTNDITIDTIEIIGSNPTDFTVTQPSRFPDFLTPGTTIPTLLTVQFQATAIGLRTATMRIVTSEETIEIPLKGSAGEESGFQLSQTQIDFGKEGSGAWRDTIIQMYCTGPDSGTVQGMQVSESDTSFQAWFPDHMTFPFHMGKGDSVSVAIRFYGMQLTGIRTATLQIIGGTLNSPSCTLTGDAELGEMRVNPIVPVDFGTMLAGDVRDTTVYLINPSDVDIRLIDVEASGSVGFTWLDKVALPLIVRRGDSIPLHVRASPDGSVSAPSTQLLFVSDDVISPNVQSIQFIANVIHPTLSVQGYQRVQYYCARPGNVDVLTVVSDTGNVTTTITRIAANDPNITVSSNVPTPVIVTGGNTVPFELQFDPQTASSDSIVIEFYSGNAVVLRDTIAVELLTAEPTTSIVTFETDSLHSSGELRTGDDLTAYQLDTLVIHLESSDPTVAAIAPGSIQLAPGFSSSKIERIDPVSDGYDVTISSPSPITAQAGSAIVTFNVDRFVSISDSANIITTIVAPERIGCIQWIADSTSIASATVCGSSVIKRFLSGKPLVESIALREDPVRTDAALDVMASTPGYVSYQVVDGLGVTVLQGGCSLSTGSNELLLPISSFASGAYVVRVVVNSGETHALRLLKLK